MQKILRRGGKNTQKNYTKKDLHDPDNHDGMITHLQPDILEYEVKWALGSITMNKASGGDGIPAEIFQILKDDAVKVLHSICQQIWKTQQWPQDWKRSIFIPIAKKGNAKEYSNYKTITLISHSSKSNAQNSPSQNSIVPELRTSRCSSWIQKRQRNQRLNCKHMGFTGGSAGKNLPAMQETWVLSLGWENPMEKGNVTHSSIQAWRIPWTGLLSTGS